MRLFIALNFSDKVKEQVKDIINKGKLNSIQGKFVNEEYMHLTVEFLGEIPNGKVDMIKDVMDDLEFEPFTLKLNEIGYFKRREGNIYWLGIEKHDALLNIHDELHQKLIEQGFELEDREYKPHLTIGRKVKLKDGFDARELNNTVEKIEINIDKIDLMKSEFIDGKLMHSIIHSRKLS